MSRTTEKWLRQIKTERKKFIIAGLLVVVAGVMWGRLYLRGSGAPAAAEAALVTSDGAATTENPAPERSRTPVYLDLPQELHRDLFALAPTHYGRNKSPEFTPTEAKSPGAAVDNTQQVLVVRQAARDLKLQTTILGTRPRAVINGQVVAPGDRVGGFTVQQIRERQVIVEMDGVQVLLEM